MDIAVWMINGWRNAGKTTFCHEMAQTARSAGWDVAGLLSPATFNNGAKDSIWTEDIRSSEKRLLAARLRQAETDLNFGDWFFNSRTFEWGNRVLQASTPCDLLVIDELGPLEFNLRTGWMAAFEVLKTSHFHLALVVIRPELAQSAQAFIHSTKTIQLNNINQVNSQINLFGPLMMRLKGDS
jgi:nucleoside-triphosphatase THEP1